MAVTRDQLLALLTAHPDTWELSDVPDWLARQCAGLGLVVEARDGAWKLTEAGYRERQARLDSAP